MFCVRAKVVEDDEEEEDPPPPRRGTDAKVHAFGRRRRAPLRTDVAPVRRPRKRFRPIIVFSVSLSLFHSGVDRRSVRVQRAVGAKSAIAVFGLNSTYRTTSLDRIFLFDVNNYRRKE